MFRKPIKVKSNSQIKGSERKILKEKILQAFRTLTEAEIDDLLPKKEIVSSIKIATATDDVVQVYSVQKRPIAFDIRGKIFPTIFLLWKYPNLVPCFTTHSQVMSYLNSGADLMLPGVITPPTNTGLSKFGNLSEGAVAYVNTSDNKAAVAVGITAQSSTDMLGGKGKCLTIYHIHGDKLCTLEGLSNAPIPSLGPPDWLKLTSYEDDFPELGATKNAERVKQETEEVPVEKEEAKNEENVESPSACTTEQMDELFNYCFFVAIKYSKTLSLPILTSNFYKLQMMPVCPEGKILDIKKSSYKKLKPFLDNMCKDGIIVISEMKKGVESITAINREHPKVAEFYTEPSLRPKREESEPQASTSITESYIITPNVFPIFADAGLNKGDTVQMLQIRQIVTEYIKKNDCQNEENKRLIRPKEALVKICKTGNQITWEEVMEKVCEAMKSCYKVTSGNEELFNKGKVSPITLSISQRSGNKKVTLIDNLECFGINIPEFAKECQHGVAASTSISKPIGKKCDQLLVQGNQILFVYNLLTEKYKIPIKYIRGLEHAPKKKK